MRFLFSILLLVGAALSSVAAVTSRNPFFSWQDNSSNETEFVIERAVGGGAFAELARVPANITLYRDSSATAAGVYRYRVYAVTLSTRSTMSEEVAIKLVGRLINLSTRGWVDGGERVMIAGLVIDRLDARVLIRCVGPGLALYGIAAPLAAPSLRIVRVVGTTSEVIATNSGWAGDEVISEAAASVGAFPLEPGSVDAALLITLPPGTYTAIASGPAGTSGIALVEVYEVP